MSTYADTGFLCSLYAPDAHTKRASSRMATPEDTYAATVADAPAGRPDQLALERLAGLCCYVRT